jgi:hypothetical protein
MAKMEAEGMKKILFVAALCLAGCVLATPPRAHADYYNYPCNYPAVGSSGSVDLLIHAGGQYCDFPMEVNGSHYHCESGGGGVGGGAIGLAPIDGGLLTLGGFGGSGVGMSLGRCEWECPDKTPAPAPNPPGGWTKHLVLDARYNDCRDHMFPAGPDSAPQAPESGPEASAGKPVSPLPDAGG